MTSVDPRHLLWDEIRLVEVEVEVEVEARGLACGLKSLREICPSACVFLCVCVMGSAWSPSGSNMAAQPSVTKARGF